MANSHASYSMTGEYSLTQTNDGYTPQWSDELPDLTKMTGRTRAAAKANHPTEQKEVLLFADQPIDVPRCEDINLDSGSLAHAETTESAAEMHCRMSKPIAETKKKGTYTLHDIAVKEVGESIVDALRRTSARRSPKGWRATDLGVSSGTLKFDVALLSDFIFLKAHCSAVQECNGNVPKCLRLQNLCFAWGVGANALALRYGIVWRNDTYKENARKDAVRAKESRMKRKWREMMQQREEAGKKKRG